MPSPSTSSSTSVVPLSYDSQIDPLLAQLKWGGAVGSGASLTFSFPWTSNSSATFTGYNGAAYSSFGENTATDHFGLNATQAAAARGALQAWANVANIGFSEVADTSTNVGDIRFGWTSATQPTSTGNQAWGWAAYPNAYWPSGGDIWISTQGSGATDPSWAVGSYNYGALIHEIGHAIGLKHTFDGSPTLPASLDTRQYSVMSYTNAAHSLFVKLTHNANGSVSSSWYHVQPETPMVLDIAAIQYVYGANRGYRTGDDVYTFDPATPFIKTIWDAGGNDTISVANFSRGCTIDLRPGRYSSIAIPSDSTAGYNWMTPPPAPTYDGTDNLGIAYSATIENAVGGAGGDVLRGNDVANHLDGGAGDDTLYGAAGDDFFDWDAAQRAGSDVFYGGAGDDTFVLTAGDQVVEYANEGTDTVYVSFSYTLGDNLDILVVTGLADLALTGNALDNLITGGAGNDTVQGGAGNDAAVYDGPRSGYVITASGIGFTIWSSASGTDLLSGVEFAQFSDTRVALIDAVAPAAVTFNPADEAAGIAIGSNVVLTFSEPIQRGTGSIVLKTAGGTTVGTYDAATSANLSISGSTLTLDPTGDLAYSTGYVVEFAAGSVKDLAGNNYAGTGSYNFTTRAAPDLIAPTTLTFNPVDEAAGVGIGSNVVLTFSEAIQRGTGNIVLKTAAGAVVASYDAGSSANLSITGNTLTIDPGTDLSYGTGYKVEFAAGSIKDLAGNSYAGTTSYNFTTTPAGVVVAGTAGPDTLIGTAGPDSLQGNHGNDILRGMGNDDALDGGSGLDTAQYSGIRANYTITRSSQGFGVSGPDGSDSLVSVERLAFSDSNVALDVDGSGGQAYRMYQAAFNRTPDSSGLGFWIKALDDGANLRDVALGFVGSAEFRSVYGANPSNAQLVTRYYENVLHRAPDASGYDYWLGVLDQHRDTAAGVLADISESAENQVGVIGVIGNGFAYAPFG